MQAGDLEVTVFQDAEGQGGGGVEAAVKLVNGETVATTRRRPVRARHPGEHPGLHRRTSGAWPAPPVDASHRVVRFGGPARWASEPRNRAGSTLVPATAGRVAREQREAGDGRRRLLLRMEGISKSFPGVQALDDVHLDVEAGHGPRADGRERRRQVHADEGPHRHVPPRCRDDRARRRARCQIPDSGHGAQARHLDDPPGAVAGPRDDRRREHLPRARAAEPLRADRQAADDRRRPAGCFERWKIDIDPRARDEDASASPRPRWSRSPRRSPTTRG